MPHFTVLLPVLRPPALLPFAVESVLAQTVTDFELMVICDGAPDETAACARAFEARDRRVKTFAHPKGERHGEAYRHAALTQASSEFVAHICDDDLWFPNHLEEIGRLLEGADFGHVIHTGVHRDGSVGPLLSNLADPAVRARYINEYYNRFGPTFCGYRLGAYRSLTEGWAPAPQPIATDLHMWRKFLRREDFKFASRAVVTAIHFPTEEREAMSLAERAAENERWYELIKAPDARCRIVEEAIRAIIARSVRNEQHTSALETAHAEAVASRAEFEASARAEIARAGEALHAKHVELTRANEALAVARSQLDAATQTHADFEASARTEIARAAEALRAKHAELTEAQAARRQADTALHQEAARARTAAADLDEILRSKSWRLTAPLRTMMRLIKRS